MGQTLHAKAIITAVNRASGPLMAISGAFQSLHKSLDRSFGAIGRVATDAGRSLTLAATLPAALAIKSYATFEDALLDVKKAFGGSDAQFNQLKSTIIALSNAELPLARDQVAKLAEEGVKANIAFKDLTEFIRLGGHFSVAFGTSAEKSASILGNMKTALKLTVPELRLFADTMNKLANKASLTEGQMLEFLNRVGPLINKVGGKEQARQFLAFGGALVAAGTQVEVATTGVRNMFVQLSRGESATKTTRAALKELGLAAKDVKKAFANDPLAVVRDLFKRLEKAPKENRLKLLADLFDVRAVDSLGKLNLDEFKRQFDLISDPNLVRGSTLKEFNDRIQGLTSQFTFMKNAVLNATGAIVEHWRPQIMAAIKSIHEFGTNFQTQPAIIKWAAAIVGSLALLGPALWAVGIAMTGIVSIVGGLSTLFAGLAALVGGPVAWAILALAAYAVLISSNWEQIAPFFESLWARVKDSFVDFNSWLLSTAIPWGIEVAGSLKEGWGDLSGFFTTVWAGVTSVFEAAFAKIKAVIDKIKAAIAGIAGSLSNSALGRVLGLSAKPTANAAPGLNLESLLTAEALANMGSGPSVPGVPRQQPFVRDVAPGIGPQGMGPIEAQVTGPVTATLEGKGQVDVRVKVDGPGQVNGLNASDDGRNIQLNTGAGMGDVKN